MYSQFSMYCIISATARQILLNDLCAQQRLKPARASAQSDQSLCCLHEETMGP